jgi:hypothetical protein
MDIDNSEYDDNLPCPGCRIITDEYGSLCINCNSKYVECVSCDTLKKRSSSFSEEIGCIYCFECYCQIEKLSVCNGCNNIIKQGVIVDYIHYCLDCHTK